jgi:recombinational DNA repair protein (RecF pathway)
MGKGIARGGRTSGELPETFGEAILTFSFKPERELHTLRELQKTSGTLSLGRDLRRFLGASFVAELLLTHALEEGDPDLYHWIRSVVIQLGVVPEGELPGWILAGGWKTLSLLGFAPELERCVGCGDEIGDIEGDRFARFDAAAGGLRCPSCSEGTALPRVGQTARLHLRALVQGAPPPSLPGGRAHLALLEEFALHHLAAGKAFRSVGMLRPLLEAAPETP